MQSDDRMLTPGKFKYYICYAAYLPVIDIRLPNIDCLLDHLTRWPIVFFFFDEGGWMEIHPQIAFAAYISARPKQ